MTELTILMPCLNEAETLKTCIVKAQDYLKRAGVDGEVLIADNGSTDGSQKIVRRLGGRVVDVPLKGYGAALGAGIADAKGRYVIMGDSDDSYDFSNLDPFLEELRKGANLVMGKRFKGALKRTRCRRYTATWEIPCCRPSDVYSTEHPWVIFTAACAVSRAKRSLGCIGIHPVWNSHPKWSFAQRFLVWISAKYQRH